MKITEHAKERATKYNISKELLVKTINEPDSVTKSHTGRKIYQKKLNGYVLRVIVEEEKELKTIITTYKARRERYGI